MLLDAEGKCGGVFCMSHDGGDQARRLNGKGRDQAELADLDEAGEQVLPLPQLLAGGLLPLGHQPGVFGFRKFFESRYQVLQAAVSPWVTNLKAAASLGVTVWLEVEAK